MKKLPNKFDYPASVDVSDLQSLSPILLSAADRNIKSARKKLLSTMLNIFQPKEDEFLKDWLDSGKRWNEGERLPVKTYVEHEVAHRDCLSDESASIIRHILFTHNTKPSRFPSLMNEFAALLLGRPLRPNEFPSYQTIERRMIRLDIIDWEFFVQFFKKRITSRDKYGFRQLWYMVMDDFYHLSLKQQRHIILITAEEENGTPCFKSLSTTSSINKTAHGNSSRDIQIMKEKLPACVLTGLGGSMSDNAHDVMLEGKLTFDGIMKYVEDEITRDIETIGSSDILPVIENNVKRLIINLGDPYHIDCLVIKHSSLAAFGETERDNHSQIHHRQLIQSIYDLYQSRDTLEMQGYMDIVMKKCINKDHKLVTLKTKQEKWMEKLFNNDDQDNRADQEPVARLKIKAVRERQQRWRVNSDISAWILLALEIKVTAEDSTIQPALFVWAKKIHDSTTDTTSRRIA